MMSRMSSQASLPLAIVLTAMLAGCTALVIGGGSGQGAGRYERTVSELAEDDAITAEVKARFVRDDLVVASGIDVKTELRVVTLDGTAASTEARQRAIELARGVKGVERVIARRLTIE